MPKTRLGSNTPLPRRPLGYGHLYLLSFEPRHENLFMSYADNKGADKPAHPRSLISAFVVRCLDSIIPLVSISPNFKPLSSFCSCTCRFESTLVTNPEDRFSRDETHLWDTSHKWSNSYRRCLQNLQSVRFLTFEQDHDKSNKMNCEASEDSDQSGHPPSLIRVFAVRSVGSGCPG